MGALRQQKRSGENEKLEFVDFPDETLPVGCYYKNELAAKYKVDIKTFMRWVGRFEKELLEMGYRKTDKLFTPRMVEYLFSVLGGPGV